jgi:excisionase family DNA binding protein
MDKYKQTQGTEEETGKITLIATNADELVARIVEALREGTEGAASATVADPYLNVTQAADYLDCSDRRIYDLKIDGRVRFVKDGTRLLTKKSWIDNYLAGVA